MTTLRARIIEKIVQTLNASRPSGVPEATTRRRLSNDDTEWPVVLVWPQDERREVDNRSSRLGGPESRALRVVVQAIASTTDLDLVDETVDPIIAHVDDRLGNTTLSDLAAFVTVDHIEWDAVQSERLFLVVSMHCLIRYQTTRGDSSRAQ